MVSESNSEFASNDATATGLLGNPQEAGVGLDDNLGNRAMVATSVLEIQQNKPEVGLFQQHKVRIARWVAVIIALALWQISGSFLNPIFISTPSAVISSFFHLIGDGKLPGAFVSSLFEMIAGIVIAGVIGIGIGLLMGRVRMIEKAFEPLVAFGNATPSIALLPVMEIWFGIGTNARVAFIMVICLWPMLVNTYAGVRAVRGSYTDVGKAFGLNGWKQTWKVYFPGTIPFIFIGIRISLAVGAVGMILGGQEIGDSGLGGLSSTFGSYSQTADLVATIVTTTGLALILFAIARKVQDVKFPWIADTSAGRRAS